MAHFYAVINKSSRKLNPTATGKAENGIGVLAASYKGAITVVLNYNEATGKDEFTVSQTKHMGEGIEQVLVTGIIGDKK
tara:strand:+ start:207 stop:443 length:237 start_codon:yes stop_codon:yes gene_type:complete